MAEPSYGDYTYPDGAIIVGWIVAFMSLVPIPVLAVHELFKREGSLLEVWWISSIISNFCTTFKLINLMSKLHWSLQGTTLQGRACEIFAGSFRVTLFIDLRCPSKLGKHSSCFRLIMWPISWFVHQLHQLCASVQRHIYSSWIFSESILYTSYSKWLE